MRKELFYINLLLVFIIIINIIVLSLKNDIEHFEDQVSSSTQGLITVETRPCTLHLTNDNDLCEKLSDIYKLSDLQIQVQMNKMQDLGNQASYDMMKYVKENKKNLPINACKVELQRMKEVRNMYGTSNINVFKNISRNLNYNTETLSGYCLSDVSQYSELDSSNILNILKTSVSSNLFVEPALDNSVANIVDGTDKSRYMAIRVQNKIGIDTLLQNTASICKDTNVSLENGIKFLRLHCGLIKDTQLFVNLIDFVAYDDKLRKFVTTTDDKVDNMFTYSYDKKQIMYQPVAKDAMIYKITYDYCNKIEAYTVFDNLKFSLGELRISPMMIKQNIDLNTSNVQNVPQNVPENVNKIMMSIITDNRDIENKIIMYSSNQDLMMKDISKLNREICPSIATNNNEKALCMLRANALEDEYNLLEVQKYQLKETLAKQRILYQTFLETSYKINTSKYTLKDINQMINTGITVSYSKYADMVSSDDCLYLQI